MKKTILLTGGAGFIGSHAIKHFAHKYPDYYLVNLDKLTYAGKLENLSEVADAPNYTFVRGDICDAPLLEDLFREHRFDAVIHCAAESHVDRSIQDPGAFVRTNVLGTIQLLEAAKRHWKDASEGKLFYHVSTDEVYGSLHESGLFTESSPYRPQSPYASSKASADHFVRAYANTYQLPAIISCCSNNYGPHQFPEKLIPLCIQNLISQKPLPVYGTGANVRDWLFVQDHVRAVDVIFHEGKPGETYNIGGQNEWTNLALVQRLCRMMDEKLQRPHGASESLVTYVTDRAGHDLRYAIDASKMRQTFRWKPLTSFEDGLSQTIDWYMNLHK